MAQLAQALMRWLLDTNVWIDALAGAADAEDVLNKAREAGDESWTAYCAISLVEALGFAGLTVEQDLEFRQVFRQFNEVVIISEVIEKAIEVRRIIRIKTPDALIAASAIVSNATLITRNTADFKNIPNLQVLSPDQV